MTNGAHKFYQEADNVVVLVDQRRRILGESLHILYQWLVIYTVLFCVITTLPWLVFRSAKPEEGWNPLLIKTGFTALCVTAYGYLFYRVRRTSRQLIEKFNTMTKTVQTNVERVKKEGII